MSRSACSKKFTWRRSNSGQAGSRVLTYWNLTSNVSGGAKCSSSAIFPCIAIVLPASVRRIPLNGEAQQSSRVALEDHALFRRRNVYLLDRLDGSLGAVVADLRVERRVGAEQQFLGPVEIVGAHQRRGISDERGVGVEPAEIIGGRFSEAHGEVRLVAHFRLVVVVGDSAGEVGGP